MSKEQARQIERERSETLIDIQEGEQFTEELLLSALLDQITTYGAISAERMI